MIKFLDLKSVNNVYSSQLHEAVERVIERGWYLLGEEVRDFEQQLATYLHSTHVIAVGNGLDALRIILRGYMEMGKLKEGDEVIVPANTYIATLLSISYNRLTPVLVEPDELTCNIDISKIEAAITPRTKAIMVVHLYGRACWSDRLTAIAQQNNLLLIEDNAQAIGAEWRGRKSGTLGNAAGCSFYPGKNLGALGDAGAIITADAQLAKVVRSLANYGSEKKYLFQYQGYNSRLDEIQAAILSVKLPYIDADNNRRREIAQQYCDGIINPLIQLPQLAENPLEQVWHIFAIRTQERDRLQSYLMQQGIETLIHYPIPPHKQHCYADWNSRSYPITEEIHRTILSLPIYPTLRDEEVLQVIEAVNHFK